jgi:carbamoyl-phosphate synthase large subunit
MEICYDAAQFDRFVAEAFVVAQGQPVLIDRFLEDAIEVDVDAIADGQQVIVGGIMEHIEEAGVHSGDSSCVIPPHSLSTAIVEEIRQATTALAEKLQVRGLMNVQYAVKRQDGHPNVYVLEVNPRASRTVPFVSKATGMPLAKAAAKVMVGVTLADQGYSHEPAPKQYSVKAPVFPFAKFAGIDVILGPEMRSTGEVMGVSESFPIAFAKSLLAAGTVLPTSGDVFLSVAKRGKEHVVELGRRLERLSFELLATRGTAERLEAARIHVRTLMKLQQGHPNVLDYMIDGRLDLIVNTPSGKGARTDEGRIRAAAVMHGVPCITTIEGALAAIGAMEALHQQSLTIQAVQDRFPAKTRVSTVRLAATLANAQSR